jgi:uncharacterized protein
MVDLKPALEVGDDGVRLLVRVTPRAARSAILGLTEVADGRQALKLSVTAVPEDGKANEAVIALLARAWRLPKTSITIIAGGTDRIKRLSITGPSGPLFSQLSQWLAGLKAGQVPAGSGAPGL